MKVAGTGVIPQSLPGTQHVVLASRGQLADGRKTLHEPQEVVITLHDTRLLQNDFRNPNAIGVFRPAPREIAPMNGIPAFESGGKRVCFVFNHKKGRIHRECPAPELRRTKDEEE